MKRGSFGAYGGVWRSLRLAGVWSQAVHFVLLHLAVIMKMFSHLIYFINTFYKLCTFSAIFKYNVAINYITVQHKKGYSRQLRRVLR
jgi:hypothetical protein